MLREEILLVEDDPSVREIISLFLSEEYEVKQTATGEEALALLNAEKVALVVLDYRLPGRTGLDVLAEMRSTRPWLPVIVITAYGSEWLCASAFKLGARDYFPKPFNLSEFVDSIRCILSRGQRAIGRQQTVLPNLRGASPRLPPLQIDLPIQKVVKLIQQRYWDRLCLSELADTAGMNKYLLSRRFRAAMGVTVRDYLTRLRLERAKELLQATRYSITEIAQMVGFGDLPRLDKLFKHHTGLAPSAYRSQHRATKD